MSSLVNRLNVTAVIIALNEEQFITACIGAIYSYVQRIYIVTNYDTDYSGRTIPPDATLQKILSFPDVDKKIVLLAYRGIKDEVVQRNWAMASDKSYSRILRSGFAPHTSSIDDMLVSYRETDYYWVIDADEIYDSQTIPAILDFVSSSRAAAIAVRGYNHFKKWNYRISPKSDHFWQIGFLKSGREFWSRRTLYCPKFIYWLWRIHPRLSEKATEWYKNQIKVPEEVGFFYHGSYIGDTSRIRKKMFSSSHCKELGREEIERWISNVWEKWSPGEKNFFFKSNPMAFSEISIIPSSKLPKSIVCADWPKGWID